MFGVVASRVVRTFNVKAEVVPILAIMGFAGSMASYFFVKVIRENINEGQDKSAVHA